MLFNTLDFLCFLGIVVVLHRWIPHALRNAFLLGTSYVFYAFWDWRFCFLLLLSTCVDWHCGHRIHRASNRKTAKYYLLLSLAGNLGVLGFFKYFNFFSESFSQLLDVFGMEASFTSLNIILPVGISFYTFQTLSYTIDIYRKEIAPQRSFLDYALYVSFFPQLVAGPIERAKHLLPQVNAERPITIKDYNEGAFLVLRGFAKKVLISDNITQYVDTPFLNVSTSSTAELWIGALFFSVQIYFDFSGYTDIARGISRWFGFDLMENFKQPYFSKNISEFWSRWHISLSTWLRDYLYIPLGGNRHGAWKMHRNLMLTMLLGGLWHGASWNFVLWGALHGVYLCLHKLYQCSRITVFSQSLWAKFGSICFVYILVTLTWVPFRAEDLSDTLAYLMGLFSFHGSVGWKDLCIILIPIVIILCFDMPSENRSLARLLKKLPLPIKMTFVVCLIVAILIALWLGMNSPKPFIYFQF